MRLIDHDEGVVFLREFVDLIERADIAVHGEDTVGGDDTETLCLGLFEFGLEVCHVAVRVTVTDRLAETYAVDDRGMVEGIGDDCVLFGQQRFKETTVGIETSGIEDGILGAKEVRDDTLKLFVGVLGATDETDRCHAVSTCVHAGFGCLDELFVIGEAEVVVGAEVNHFLSAFDGDTGGLRRDDHALVLI